MERFLVFIIIMFFLYIIYDVFIRESQVKLLLHEKGVHATAIMQYADAGTNGVYYMFFVDTVRYSGSYGLDQLPGVHRLDTLSVLYLPENPKVNAIPENVNTSFIQWVSKFRRK